MKTCIVNFAKGQWYPKGQARLVKSLDKYQFPGDVLTYTDESQIGCPSHQEAPYVFKPAIIKNAIDMGYDIIIWADCSVWAIQNFNPFIKYMQNNSHYWPKTGFSVHTWSSDKSLEYFNISRDEAKKISMLYALFMCFNMTYKCTQQFIEEWYEASKMGIFTGSWINDKHQVSLDSTVKGHRHDQTVASIIANKLDMNFTNPPSKFICLKQTYDEYYNTPKWLDTVTFLACGM